MLRICFSGDLNFSGFFSKQLGMAFSSFSSKIIDYLNENHFNVFNIEGPLTSFPSAKKVGISLANEPEVLTILKELKCNIFNLSNNHMMDCGLAGLTETIELAQQNGILSFGAGKDIDEASKLLIVENDGIKVALLGICHKEGKMAKKNRAGVFSDKDEKLIKHRIKEAKKAYDWVVVNYHGGEEFTFFPMPKRRNKFLKYLHYGADIIIAHHPHVVQGYEVYGNKCIFYSLGNFVFDIEPHYQHEGSNESILIKINFNKKNYSFDKLFTIIKRQNKYITCLVDNNRFIELDRENYYRNWCQDSFRVLFNKRKLTSTQNNKDKEQQIRIYSILSYLTRYKVYLFLIRIARGKNSRALLIGAINYIVRKKLGIW